MTYPLADVTIQETRSTRIAYMVIGIVLTAAGLAGAVYLTLSAPPFGWLAGLTCLFPAGLGMPGIYKAWHPAHIDADELHLRYSPSFGKSKELPRGTVRSIVRLPRGRGFFDYEFRDQANATTIKVGDGFSKADVEGLAHYIGTKLIWDASNSIEALSAGDLAKLPPDVRARIQQAMDQQSK